VNPGLRVLLIALALFTVAVLVTMDCSGPALVLGELGSGESGSVSTNVIVIGSADSDVKGSRRQDGERASHARTSPQRLTVRVAVVDEDGSPIAGARVSLSPPHDGLVIGATLERNSQLAKLFDDSRYSSHSAGDGIATIQNVPAEWRAIAILCGTSGYVKQVSWHELIADHGVEADLATITLQPATALRFRVLDAPSSTPIEGAEVIEIASVGGKRSSFSAATDSEGNAVILGRIAKGMKFFIRAPGHLDHHLNQTEYVESLTKEGVAVVRLEVGLGLKVVVRDRAGQAVPTARVFVSQTEGGRVDATVADPRSVGSDRFRGLTGPDGVLQMGGISQARGLLVLAELEGRYAWDYPVEAGQTVDLTLGDLLKVLVQFVTPTGDPIGEMNFAVVSADLVGWPPVASGISDAKGNCELLLQPGAYGIFASNQKWAVASEDVFVVSEADSGPLTFTASLSAGISFTVEHDKATPGSGPLSLTLSKVYPNTRPSHLDTQISWPELRANFNEKRAGRLYHGDTVMGLIPGHSWALVRGPKCVPQFLKVQLEAGKLTQVVTEVIPACSLAVKLVDPLGVPVAKAWLWATALEDTPTGASFLASFSSRTDLEGKAFMTPFFASAYRVEAARNRNARRVSQIIELQVGENSTVLVLKDLLGSVIASVDEQLLQGAVRPTVMLRPQGRSSDLAMDREISLSPDGTARFESVESGAYSVVLVGTSAADSTMQVEVEEGTETQVFFQPPSGPELEVWLRDSEDHPVASATILLTPADTRGGRSGRERRLLQGRSVPSVEMIGITSAHGSAKFWLTPGQEYLALAHRDGFQISEERVVAQFDGSESQQLQLTLLPSARLKIFAQVLSKDGEENLRFNLAQDLRLKVRQSNGAVTELRYDNPERVFQSTVLAPGPATLIIEALTAKRKLIKVATREIVLALGNTHEERIRVNLPGGE
jgi:hypothetical protein